MPPGHIRDVAKTGAGIRQPLRVAETSGVRGIHRKSPPGDEALAKDHDQSRRAFLHIGIGIGAFA